MRLRKNIATSGEGFIFNPSTGDSFSTNEIGAEIIALLKEEKQPKEVIDKICSKYEVTSNHFEKDLDDYLAQLKDFLILE